MSDEWCGIKRSEIDWYPAIDETKCDGCMICVNMCGKGVFEVRDNKPYVRNPNSCRVGCECCSKRCPKKALNHPDQQYVETLKSRPEYKPDQKTHTCSL